ncbi:arylsulfatase [Horticoccus sp. 23ND18S-11]|uniref:arylsulfatase n=1 Tax=Horticoccus sp. 23ND18S-11 TaxID=3391832 RepID=UPI0039C92457
MRFLISSWFLVLASVVFAQAPKPNIIFILADDLGYGELGSYGAKLIETPHLDRMAAEGMRFTQFYAGSTVCAPSRSVLMTGLHTGHTRVRGNAGGRNMDAQSLQQGDVTVARVLKDAGYATGLVGKWGLGENDQPGEPRRQGFDYFYGYLSQTHAHNHYPSFLWRNGEKVPLPNDLVQVGPTPGAGYSTKRLVYGGDLFAAEAQAFVERNQAKPFFLFYSVVTPHANNERSRELGEGNEVPDQGIYAGKPWPESMKNHAAMITRLDRDVGALFAQLKRLGLDERTLVLFSSDNGPHKEGGPNYDPVFFTASGPLQGIKRSMTDGGIRVPFIARWPGKIKGGTVSNHVGYFGDLMATWSEVGGAKAPGALDSVSLAPTLLGRGPQAKHPHLYWEFYEQGVSQALLIDGRWKAIRLKTLAAPVQLFDVANDIGERTDVAAKNPAIVARAVELMKTARVDNEHWKLSSPPARAP